MLQAPELATSNGEALRCKTHAVTLWREAHAVCFDVDCTGGFYLHAQVPCIWLGLLFAFAKRSHALYVVGFASSQ